MKKDRRMPLSTAKILAATLIAALFITTFCYTIAWGVYDRRKEIQYSDPVFAKIDADTLEGGHYSSDELKDSEYTVFNVWETTCSACLGEMPELEELSQEYDPSKIRLVGICADLLDKNGKVDESQLKKARELMQSAGTTFTHLIPDQTMMSYIDSVVLGFPTTFVVDSSGNLIRTTSGSRSLKDWEEYLSDLTQ